jgi:hypothetical protein
MIVMIFAFLNPSVGGDAGSGAPHGGTFTVTVAPGPCDPNKVEISSLSSLPSLPSLSSLLSLFPPVC